MDSEARVAIRLGSDEDVVHVLNLWSAAAAVPGVTDDAEAVRIAVEREVLLVAESDGQIAGSLIAAFDGWRGNMYRLAVHPDQRRRGIATALVDEAERRLGAQGCRRVSALVMGEHDHATEFWRAAGYQYDERIERYVKTTAASL